MSEEPLYESEREAYASRRTCLRCFRVSGLGLNLGFRVASTDLRRQTGGDNGYPLAKIPSYRFQLGMPPYPWDSANLRHMAQFQAGSFLRLTDFCITQLKGFL